MSFTHDLLQGMEKEEHVRNFFAQWLPVSLVEKKERGYDFLVLGAVEVKYDRQALKTGNIAVEFEYRKKPSGLNATHATNWVFVTDEGAWIVPTGVLREHTIVHQFPIKTGGDKKASHFYLIPYQFIKDNYTNLFYYEQGTIS